MICTDEERDALMAAVREVVTHYAKHIQWPDEDDRASFCEDIESDLDDAIRAMLAPPDDAVVIPRDLAIRAIDRIERLAWWETECGEDEIARGSQIDADIFQDILRGEASSDE